MASDPGVLGHSIPFGFGDALSGGHLTLDEHLRFNFCEEVEGEPMREMPDIWKSPERGHRRLRCTVPLCTKTLD